MGVLETRNLDFDHVLVLSCQEGNMPKGVSDSSFIPYSIRKAYGLTTIDHKVAVYAYYFHRLIQRAKDVTILYNNATEDGHKGEMSRFMLQLMVESNLSIRRQTLRTGQEQTPLMPKTVEKSPAVVEKLHALAAKGIYPTFINRYLRCQLQFYYQQIEGIKEPDMTDEEQIDNRVFGNIFHRASQLLYEKMKQKSRTIMPGDIEEVEKHPEEIEMVVDKAFQEEVYEKGSYSKADEQGNGLHLINREVIIHYLKRLLKIDKQLAPFQVIGLEKYVDGKMSVNTTEGPVPIKMGGIIDRLDLITEKESGRESIRVVDYKTGSKALTSKINDIDEIFVQPIVPKKHADYYLQTMLYALFVRHNKRYNEENLPVSPALLFIQHTGGDNYDPVLPLGKEKIHDISDYEEAFRGHIEQVLTDIFEPTLPFRPTDDHRICANCPYRLLCGLHR
jgi:CRISPR/Cas system-associated exonuclease Cas4 (RecB family)